MAVWCRRAEHALLVYDVDYEFFHTGEVVEQYSRDRLFQLAATVELDVLDTVVGLEQYKAHESGHHDLAALGREELLEVVVRERGELDVDLADNADLDAHARAVGGHGGVIGGDFLHVGAHDSLREAASGGELDGQPLYPFL